MHVFFIWFWLFFTPSWYCLLKSVTEVICQQSLNPKNQVLYKSKSLSPSEPINTNRKQISLTETNYFNSNLFSFRKNNHSVFLIFQKIFRRKFKNMYFWYIHFSLHYTRVCREFSVSTEHYIFLWTRTVFRFFNIWSMKKSIFSFASISKGFY